MLEEIACDLKSIEDRGSFASRETTRPENLKLQIKDVGVIRFPVSATRARKLCRVARPSGFGWRDKTLVDKAVRDTWEIARSKVKIDQREWKKTLGPQLLKIQENLGLPADGRLQATLYKMLIYEPGQFFMPHQDSEKADGMVGTLAVVLPSAYTGGSVEIEHRGEKVTYRRSSRSAEKLTFIAFYADCHHQVRPIKEGYRVVLVYNLFFEGPARTLLGPDDGRSIDVLTEHVNAHFTTPLPVSPHSKRAPQPPDKLVYLLDHDYTQRSLGWSRLKNADSLRATALRTVAERLDCEIYMALADIQELWSCEDDYRWRYRRYDDYLDDDDDEDLEAYELIELMESTIELRHWLDASDKRLKSVPTAVDSDEVCFTKASVELEPFKSEHEGWMGNYGNTVDRWYHRAAIVMWPRSRLFSIRAKISPRWAIDELTKLLKAKSLREAREKARSLVPFWDNRALREEGKPFLSKTLGVARMLEDQELAGSLLAPFRLEQLGAQAVPHLVGLLQTYGLGWCRDRFLEWEDGGNRYPRAHAGDWLGFMPELCHTLRTADAGAGLELAQWVVSHQWSLIKERCAKALEDPESPYAGRELATASKHIVYVLESCLAVNGGDVHDDIVEFLTAAETGFPVAALVSALRACRGRHAPRNLKKLDLGGLLDHCVSVLTEKLAEPPRSADDWSITPRGRCKCDLCEGLDQFLARRDQRRLEWPLAEGKRAHIHRQIDRYVLPVKHVTRRKGRPYTLVLEKLDKLFTCEAEVRKSQQREFTWLKQQRRAFS